MSKVDEYTGNGMIVVSDGEVWAVDDSGLPDVIGEIGRVELSIEMPENLMPPEPPVEVYDWSDLRHPARKNRTADRRSDRHAASPARRAARRRDHCAG